MELKNKRIMVVDNESEAVVQQALTKLLKNRTVFVIAHRLSTIKDADRILVLEKGHITESGSHDELLLREGLYHKLYHLQFKKTDTSPHLASAI